MQRVTDERNWFAEAMESQGRQNLWIAGKLGVSQSSVSRWRNGIEPIPARHEPRLRYLLNLEEVNA